MFNAVEDMFRLVNNLRKFIEDNYNVNLNLRVRICLDKIV